MRATDSSPLFSCIISNEGRIEKIMFGCQMSKEAYSELFNFGVRHVRVPPVNYVLVRIQAGHLQMNPGKIRELLKACIDGSFLLGLLLRLESVGLSDCC